MAAGLTVVCWKWHQPGYRRTYTAEHVNILRRMVARHYRAPHRFVCVTDEPAGLDRGIEPVALWNDHAGLKNFWRPGGPSCYRRLRMFSDEARDWFGERFISIDLDTVILGDLSPIFDRPDDFCIWGDTAKGTPFNGSLILMTAGARRQVWDEFNPRTSPLAARKLGYVGSDQAWIGACLGPDQPKFTAADGVLSFRNEVSKSRHPPAGARVVFFHGKTDPWSKAVQAEHPWIAQFYR